MTGETVREASNMAQFHRNEAGISWLRINWLELIRYSDNLFPVCDECLCELFGKTDIILIPVLNQAFCAEHGEKVLARLKNDPEDKPYAAMFGYDKLKEILLSIRKNE
jgi:hypothetical protein